MRDRDYTMATNFAQCLILLAITASIFEVSMANKDCVYLLANFWSFLNCDVKKAKMLANPKQGAEEGFKFVLKKWQPYYFACGERNGFHCNNGQMKFAVIPMLRPFWPWP
ncbi:hypothetical protein D0Y65_018533 [Glycine soja]|uniref:Phytocyanin domain-containing protein n=1 Tax=Glycine soja TaxID=3848 RepID=A0A445JZH6_GLYSO|nr:hypothetical protein D0Y65_018533 [Glycine soja]